MKHQAGIERIEPISFCWGNLGSSMCSDGLAGDPNQLEPLVNSPEHPLRFDFQHPWDLRATIAPFDGDCWYETDIFPNGGESLRTLGPQGDYWIMIQGSTLKGDASWGLRIQNEIELPVPDLSRPRSDRPPPAGGADC